MLRILRPRPPQPGTTTKATVANPTEPRHSFDRRQSLRIVCHSFKMPLSKVPSLFLHPPYFILTDSRYLPRYLSILQTHHSPPNLKTTSPPPPQNSSYKFSLTSHPQPFTHSPSPQSTSIPSSLPTPQQYAITPSSPTILTPP